MCVRERGGESWRLKEISVYRGIPSHPHTPVFFFKDSLIHQSNQSKNLLQATLWSYSPLLIFLQSFLPHHSISPVCEISWNPR